MLSSYETPSFKNETSRIWIILSFQRGGKWRVTLYIMLKNIYSSKSSNCDKVIDGCPWSMTSCFNLLELSPPWLCCYLDLSRLFGFKPCIFMHLKENLNMKRHIFYYYIWKNTLFMWTCIVMFKKVKNMKRSKKISWQIWCYIFGFLWSLLFVTLELCGSWCNEGCYNLNVNCDGNNKVCIKKTLLILPNYST